MRPPESTGGVSIIVYGQRFPRCFTLSLFITFSIYLAKSYLYNMTRVFLRRQRLRRRPLHGGVLCSLTPEDFSIYHYYFYYRNKISASAKASVRARVT